MAVNRVFVRPYNVNSKAARALADELHAKFIKIDGSSRYSGKKGDVVINFGNSNEFDFQNAIVLNHPGNVSIASDKKKLFNHSCNYGYEYIFPQTIVFQRSGDKKQYYPEHMYNYGSGYMLRTLSRASQGKGLYYVPSYKDIPDDLKMDGLKIQMISEYIKKTAEYRVHVLGGSIIDVVQKKVNTDFPKDEVNYKIRNHNNGWVFCRKDIEVPKQVLNVSKTVLEGSGLFFGAVDVIWNEFRNAAYVLEINTAPGLEGSTIKIYAEAFKKFFEEL